MEKNNQPSDFFYVFSETQPPTKEHLFFPVSMPRKEDQEQNSKCVLEPSSSSPISTELSLSTFRSQSKTKHGGGTSSRLTHYSSNVSKKNRKTGSTKTKSKSTVCCNKDSDDQWGYSTTLKLYDDPWKVKKVLTTSDLGKLNRLLLGTDLTENFMLPVLGDAQKGDTGESSEMGTPVRVWDVDTMSMHHLILKRWYSFKNYVLIGNWNQDFVKRRSLKPGDEIGLHWDSYKRCFNFSVLKRAMADN